MSACISRVPQAIPTLTCFYPPRTLLRQPGLAQAVEISFEMHRLLGWHELAAALDGEAGHDTRPRDADRRRVCQHD